MENFLKGDNLFLRAVEPNDLDLLYKWENTTGVWGISDTVVPFSKCVLNEFIAVASKDIYENKQLRLMISQQSDNETIGAVDIFDFDPYHNRAGVGIFIDEALQGKGIGFEAMSILIGYAFDFLGINQLYCTIPEDNEASIGLFKKLGFEITGERKEWLRGIKGYMSEYFLQLHHTKKRG